MAISGIIFSNQHVSAAEHASLFRMMVSDGVIRGCSISAGGNVVNQITIEKGLFVVCGRLVKITSDHVIADLDTTKEYARIKGVIDLSGRSETDGTSENGTFTQFRFDVDYSDTLDTFTEASLNKDDVNSGETTGTYEVEWAVLRYTNNAYTVVRSISTAKGDAGGGSSEGNYPSFTYSAGAENDAYLVGYDENGNWEIALLKGTNATLKFLENPGDVEIFLQAGGKTPANRKGGSGGAHKVVSSTLSSGANYSVTVGAADADSTFDASSSAGGTAGASGGWKPGAQQVAANGGDGVLAFGSATSLIASLSGRKYGAGGGGGKYYYTEDGTNWTNISATSGGTTGGGSGGTFDNTTSRPTALPAAGNGEANTGSGGGGTNQWKNSATSQTAVYGAAGNGGSGIVIIRNKRTA